MRTYILYFLCCMSALNHVQAKTYISHNEATELIELYTSEGCSSCPAADRWLSELSTNPRLFSQFIPLAFHVDYWNNLGWHDRFSSPQNSQRQYQHQKAGRISQVYTPAFVVANKEWRGWRFSQFFDWPNDRQTIGILKAQSFADTQKLEITFLPENTPTQQQYLIHSAILGMGLSSKIKQGENQGRLLKHDFVVLKHNRHVAEVKQQATQTWQIAMPEIPAQGQQQNVLVIWLTPVNSEQVIQAVGGYL